MHVGLAALSFLFSDEKTELLWQSPRRPRGINWTLFTSRIDIRRN
jgi:ribosomal protein L24E